MIIANIALAAFALAAGLAVRALVDVHRIGNMRRRIVRRCDAMSEER